MIKLNSSVSAMFLGVAVLSLGACATSQESQDLAPGTKPVKEAQPAPSRGSPTRSQPVRSADGRTSTYNVVRGDHLWGIASKPAVYGNPYQWPLIYKANSDKIQDADLIRPGQVFTIDNDPSSRDADAAVRHARTRGAWSIGVVEDSDRSYLAR